MKKTSLLALLLVLCLCLPTFVACDLELPEEPDEDTKKEETTTVSATEKETEYSDNYTEGLFFERDRITNEYAVVGYEGSSKNVTVPATYLGKPVTSIAKNAFFKTDVEEIKLPDTIKVIGDNAFKSSDSLKAVYIGSQEPQLEKIGKDAFFACKNLEYIYYFGTREEWNAISLGKNWDKNTGSKTDLGTYTVYCVDDDEETTSEETYTDIETDVDTFDTESESVLVTDEEVTTEAHVCDFGEWTVVKNATCTEGGVLERFCECGENELKNTEAVGHDEISHEAKAPSCTEFGWDAYVTCSRCDYTTYMEKPALGHDEIYHEAKAPTCTEFGWDAYVTCSRCNYTTYAEKPALDHDEIYHEAKAPTCTEFGWEAYVTCSRCDYTTTYVEKEAVGHTYKNVGEICALCKEMKASEGLSFRSNGDGTCYVSGIGSCTDNNVVVPLRSPEGDSVTSIGNSAFRWCETITSITIPNSVTSIGEYAFQSCSRLTSVVLGENSKLTSIGDFAFEGCTSLTGITIPDSVTSIGGSAFSGCTSLVYNEFDNAYYLGDEYNPYVLLVMAKNANITSCKINSKTKFIGSAAFISSSHLTNISIPNGVISIGEFAFSWCEQLTQVVFEEGSRLISIEEDAFSFCSSLESISIPNSVLNIGMNALDCGSLVYNEFDNAYYLGNESNPYVVLVKAKNTDITSCDIHSDSKIIYYNAFSRCSKLESIFIPDGVVYIEESVFASCKALKSINVDKNNKLYHSEGNCLIETESKTLISGCVKSIIPADGSVTSIGDCSFYGCSTLKSITIPDSITSIGNSAFNGCSSLASITIPGSVTSMGASAFEGCSNLKSITIPEGVTKIESSTFCRCSDLTSITLPDSVLSIGGWAFDYCSSLTSITIPDGVTSISHYVFRGCSSLESITIPDSVTSIGDSAFYNCTSLESVYYIGTEEGWGKVSIGSSNVALTSANIFCGSRGLEFKSNGDNTCYVSGIGDCKDTNIIIPSTAPNGDIVTGIGLEAFEDCASITSITIPDSVTSIDSWAFSRCTNLESVTIPDSVTRMMTGVFSCCESLTYNEYDNAYYLGNEANPYIVLVKAKDNGITSCEINSNTKFIHSSAFSGCSSLTSITIPKGVISIGSAAFSECSRLESVTIPDSVTEIVFSAFGFCSSLTSATFENPNGWWCSAFSDETIGKISISSSDLANPSTAAECLASTYSHDYWRRDQAY